MDLFQGWDSPLPSLNKERFNHACDSYDNDDGEKVRHYHIHSSQTNKTLFEGAISEWGPKCL